MRPTQQNITQFRNAFGLAQSVNVSGAIVHFRAIGPHAEEGDFQVEFRMPCWTMEWRKTKEKRRH